MFRPLNFRFTNLNLQLTFSFGSFRNEMLLHKQKKPRLGLNEVFYNAGMRLN